MSKPKIVCFGEVLWDVFPNGKTIGGAPLNVALRMQSLGVESVVVSAVGADELGKKITAYCRKNHLDTDLVQNTKIFKTSTVEIVLDKIGSATYTIKKPVAWDDICINPKNEKAVRDADALVFGSLAARSETSRTTLFKLLEQSKFSVFDVNLRPPFVAFDLIFELMKMAHVIKLNTEELDLLAHAYSCQKPDIKQTILAISQITNCQTVCITKGAKGAVLFENGQFFEHGGYQVKVADTVGAGDSFLAALIFKRFILNEKPETALEFASKIGALVASKHGANPPISQSDIDTLV